MYIQATNKGMNSLSMMEIRVRRSWLREEVYFTLEMRPVGPICSSIRISYRVFPPDATNTSSALGNVVFSMLNNTYLFPLRYLVLLGV